MTMSTAFARFYADGMVNTPGAIQSGVQAELFATLRDFFQFTNVWQEDVDVSVSSSSLVYSLTVSTQKAIGRLLNLYESTDINKAWVWPATMATPGTLTLLQALSGTSSQAWTATVGLYSVDPVDSDGNPVFPSWILDKYFDTLFSGMLSRMLAQPGKPWSNTKMAAWHYRRYVAGRGLCMGEVQRANTRNAQAWSYPCGAIVRGNQRGV